MRRSFNIPRISFKNTTSVLQTAAGALLAANLIAGWFVIRPLGGSASELSDEAASLRTQLAQRRTNLDRSRVNVVKVENGRTAGDQFMEGYFLTRRTAASTILAELTAAARESHIKVKVHSFNEEPIEGSDDLSMMVISGEYEGNYTDLIEYVNRIDRSPRLLIIESLSATPQQGAPGVLNISIKFDTFVREDNGLPVISKEQPETVSDTAPQTAQQAPVVRQQQPPIMNVQPVLPHPVQPQAQPVPQPAAPVVTQTPALVPPPTRPRLPMRMQMPRRPSQAEDEDQQNVRPPPEEQPVEQNQDQNQNPPQDQNQNPPQEQNPQPPQNPNPPQDNSK